MGSPCITSKAVKNTLRIGEKGPRVCEPLRYVIWALQPAACYGPVALRVWPPGDAKAVFETPVGGRGALHIWLRISGGAVTET